jgi:hypothetical protein
MRHQADMRQTQLAVFPADWAWKQTTAHPYGMAHLAILPLVSHSVQQSRIEA